MRTMVCGWVAYDATKKALLLLLLLCDDEVHQCNASSATEQTMLRHWLATEHRWWLESPPM